MDNLQTQAEKIQIYYILFVVYASQSFFFGKLSANLLWDGPAGRSDPLPSTNSDRVQTLVVDILREKQWSVGDVIVDP